jgi:putative ABC transport system permease protein
MSSEPRRVFSLPRRSARRISQDFDRELAFHIDMRIAELVARGTDPLEARRIASAESGDLDEARQYVGAIDTETELVAHRRLTMDGIAQEALGAVRRLRRSRGFTVTAVLTLSLGIAACGLMLNIVSGVLLSPLPFRDAGQVTMIWGYTPQLNLGYSEQPIHGTYFTVIRDNATAFSSVAAFRARALNLGDIASPERLDGIEATGEFFQVMGVSAEAGQFFARPNETPGSDRVVVISDALWRRRFAGDRSIVGQSISLNAEPYTVIGVAPAGFSFPRGAEMPPDFQFPAASDVWIPLRPPTRGPSDLALVGRVRPGLTLEAARKDLSRVQAIEERLIPQGKGYFGTQLTPLRTQIVGKTEPMLVSLMVAVALLLLLACVNIAQLQLAQLQQRRRELAIRSALGASHGRLAAAFVTEVLVLTVTSGLIGTALVWVGMRLVQTYGTDRLPRLTDTTFDLRTVVAALAATAVAATAAALLPAWVARRSPLTDSLRSGGRGLAGGSVSARARRVLIVAELTLSVVLVASAGLLARSLSHQLRSATGFSAPNGLTFEVTLPPVRYAEQQFQTYMTHPAAAQFFTAALDRIRAIPGVQSAAIGKPLPLSGAQEATVFIAEGAPAPAAPGDTPMAEYTLASSEMFQALGTTMIAGRDFDASDQEASLPVVIVNQSMAKWLWPGQSAIGKRIHVGTYNMSPPWMTVVGVASDLKRYSLTESPRPEMIVPYTQKPYPSFSTMQFVVRSAVPAAQLLPAIRSAVAGVDPGIPVSRVRTIGDLVAATSATARFATGIMSAFGVSALLLAMVGLYGVIAYGVQQRRQEFGIRRALGAAPRQILRQVMIEGLRLAAIGVIAGTLLSVVAGRALRQLLYEVRAYDLVTLGGTGVVLAIATLAACLAPAWHASHVEPKVALEDA